MNSTNKLSVFRTHDLLDRWIQFPLFRYLICDSLSLLFKVFNREANGVSRKEIYNILTHAGLLSRTDPHSSQLLRHQPAVVRGHDPDILPFLQSQDLLQYLWAGK